MASIVRQLHEKNLINPPHYVVTETKYEVLMGSIAYGCSDTSKESKSDWDIYGFCIPNKDIIFSQLRGYIDGFGTKPVGFDQWEKHKIKDNSETKEYDISIYNIVKYFHLCLENNPNMIDSLFVPRRCVLFSSNIAELVRENRKLFLHKGCYHKFKSYAYSQLNKIENKSIVKFIQLCHKLNIDYNAITMENIVIESENRCPNKMSYSKENSQLQGELLKKFKYLNKIDKEDNKYKLYESISDNEFYELYRLYKQCSVNGNLTNRIESINKYGYDVKFSYNVVRLLNECVMILVEQDLDLEINREQLKSIRRGEWKKEEIVQYFTEKEKELEKLYISSKLREFKEENKIKQLLINCLEMHFGSLNNVIVKDNALNDMINEIELVIDKYRPR